MCVGGKVFLFSLRFLKEESKLLLLLPKKLPNNPQQRNKELKTTTFQFVPNIVEIGGNALGFFLITPERFDAIVLVSADVEQNCREGARSATKKQQQQLPSALCLWHWTRERRGNEDNAAGVLHKNEAVAVFTGP